MLHRIALTLEGVAVDVGSKAITLGPDPISLQGTEITYRAWTLKKYNNMEKSICCEEY